MVPMISIIIPVYNGSNYMREAIDSAIRQTYANFEIIVVNDGSNDDGATRDIALSYGNHIRYFEKENGGVSTALNLAIREMRGEYFSWLSHDDVYYPDKLQVEMEAMQESGNMMQVVFSDNDMLVMPRRKLISHAMRRMFKGYGKSVFETGALTPALGFISGCTLLIPKKYFEMCGLFDESLRGVQDYKKWFEMFRGRRMVYIDKSLVQSRVHPQQVTNTYDRMKDEEDWLYAWLVESMTQEDIEGSEIGLYQFYGAMISRFRYGKVQLSNLVAAQKVLALDEPMDAEKARNHFAKHVSNGNMGLYLYCAGFRSRALIVALRMRGVSVDGISDSNPDKWGRSIEGISCISPEHLPSDATIIVTKVYPDDVEGMLKAHGYKNVVAYDDLLGWILRTPVKKSLVEQFLREHKY